MLFCIGFTVVCIAFWCFQHERRLDALEQGRALRGKGFK